MAHLPHANLCPSIVADLPSTGIYFTRLTKKVNRRVALGYAKQGIGKDDSS